jgi:hypothetical protein
VALATIKTGRPFSLLPAKIAAFQMVMFGNVVMEPAKIAYLFDGHESREKLK